MLQHIALIYAVPATPNRLNGIRSPLGPSRKMGRSVTIGLGLRIHIYIYISVASQSYEYLGNSR